MQGRSETRGPRISYGHTSPIPGVFVPGARMLSRDDLERYLDRLSAESATTVTEVEPGLWRLHPGGALDYDVVVTYAPPVVVLRAKVLQLPHEPDAAAALAHRLLELNATDLLHGAYGVDRGAVVLTEALELSHLDYEELRASYESMTLSLASHVRELATLCDPRRVTGEYAVPAPAHAADRTPNTTPAEAR
ncbi:hypothetical protein tb265_02560 [Gemmatimonadetes bacterium T265]|nr:hypothetical protein tb265_02560 [Gemmatimonadetes bacterium T265]